MMAQSPLPTRGVVETAVDLGCFEYSEHFAEDCFETEAHSALLTLAVVGTAVGFGYSEYWEHFAADYFEKKDRSASMSCYSEQETTAEQELVVD